MFIVGCANMLPIQIRVINSGTRKGLHYMLYIYSLYSCNNSKVGILMIPIFKMRNLRF